MPRAPRPIPTREASASRAVRRRRARPARALTTESDHLLPAPLRPAQRPLLRQERAKRSYQALLDAAQRLFASAGYDAVGTPEIAAAAGVSVGTCYRYFTDKKQVFLEVMRRYLQAGYHEALDRLTPERFIGKARHETIDNAIGVLFDFVNRQPGLNRVLVEMSLRDPDIARLRASFEAVAYQRLARLIAAICPPAVIPDPEATAWVVQAAVLECATGIGGGGRHKLMDLARARKALAAMIERLLFPSG
jgi:AcrR family transcriptional regulator